MSEVLAKIGTVAAIILALPFLIAMAAFALHAVFSPGDAETNGRLAGEAIEKGVENELPAWADPVGLVLAFALAALLVGLGYLGVWAWNSAE